MPSDFDFKIVLRRAAKTKYLFGTDALGQATDVSIRNFRLKIPMFKPNQQLSEAINELMIQNGEECKYYSTQYRFISRPVAQDTSRILENDIFNGSRPTRMYTYLMTQARYNGAYTLNPHLIAFPSLNYFAVRVNESVVQPEIRNAAEAYLELRKVLNRENREMPFDFTAYESSYGFLATDLSENKDSFNEVLPNSTSGVVSVDMTLTAGVAEANQIIFVGEFRNQLKVGHKTPARRLYDF